MWTQAAVFALLALLVLSGSRAGGPPPPPGEEVRRTVDAVVGSWSGRMTAIVPGEPTETFPWSMDCREVALGAGASCTMRGEASIGPIAQGCIVAYDPSGEAVHYMCVTSMGEVHDHRGRWKGATTIAFEPLAASLRGERMKETVRWRFAGTDRLTTSSVIELADGRTMRFEFRGRREPR